ncbi:hypothetical protein RhiirB3_444873 [Rhizophagus irregularis]|nr:hypothetical protein RhiirB3_444873 [Rhizophagus irregularis]
MCPSDVSGTRRTQYHQQEEHHQVEPGGDGKAPRAPKGKAPKGKEAPKGEEPKAKGKAVGPPAEGAPPPDPAPPPPAETSSIIPQTANDDL